MQYDGEDSDLQIMSRENDGTGVEWLKTSIERESYKSPSKQQHFIMNNNTCMKKQIQDIMK